MHAPSHVNDQDIALLVAQCEAGTPHEFMGEWPEDVIAETVHRIPVVCPELATYVIACGYPKYLLLRPDIPRRSMDAVWAHLIGDFCDDAESSWQWSGTVGLLLREDAWRTSVVCFLAPSFRAMRRRGALKRLAPGEVSAGYAATAFLITDPSEPLRRRARMLRALVAHTADTFFSPLWHLAISEDVLRAAYRDQFSTSPFVAEVLLNHGCVLRDAPWCAALTTNVSPYVLAELPLRTLEALPAPDNVVRAIAIVQNHVFASAEATRVFAAQVCRMAPRLLPILTRADVLRCVAATDVIDVRSALLRMLSRVRADADSVNTSSDVAGERA
ncbi:MAG: hypothetical protein K2R93_10960 [Gemmatimonadaceae bacterium]|nr:hypothetical protein [Gemmatimonadaceae bacterium]